MSLALPAHKAKPFPGSQRLLQHHPRAGLPHLNRLAPTKVAWPGLPTPGGPPGALLGLQGLRQAGFCPKPPRGLRSLPAL